MYFTELVELRSVHVNGFMMLESNEMLSAIMLVADFILYLHSKEVQSFIVTVSFVSCVIHRHNLTNNIGGGWTMGIRSQGKLERGKMCLNQSLINLTQFFLFAPLQL
jgi:hypothetical protein